jgi:diguanylate cyclase (GGDEF)-like protein/PAS domain S-box-containing protein
MDLGTGPLTPAALQPMVEEWDPVGGYKELVENASDWVYTHDLAGNLTTVNQAVQSLTGYSREEALRLNLRDLLTESSWRQARLAMESELGGGAQAPFEVILRRKDGAHVALEVNARLLFRGGTPVGVLGIARDVSERRRNENHLRLLRSVVVNANDAVLIAEFKAGDPLGGKIVYVNEAFTRMTAFTPEDAVGRTPRILFGPQTDREQLNHVRSALCRGESARVELVNYRKDGSAYWVEVNFVPIAEGEDRAAHWVAVQREITERKRAEDLERDRSRVLEMVTRNEPLERILTQLTAMMERQCPDLNCSVLLVRNGQMVQVAGAAMTGEEIRGFRPVPPAKTVPASPAPTPPLLGGIHWQFPILSGSGEALGAFAISFRTRRKPTREELDLISKSSRLAAIAIEQRQLTDKLAYQAQHDALTGLPNRTLFDERLNRAIAQARRQGWMAAVMFIDLDRFKQINDTLGHTVGDALLQQVARRLEGCVRKTDTLARMGGDEFTLLLTEIRDPQYVHGIAEKLLAALQAPFYLDNHELFVTASIGISIYPKDGADAATLERNADSAMYRAKSLGKNNYQVFVPEINASAMEAMEIENALRRALEHREFQLRYQPQVNLRDGTLAGLEALLVWNHPKLGVIPPSQFIPIAEESGLINPIGTWVLHEACSQNAAWQRQGLEVVQVAVNVSVMQFTRPRFVDIVASALADSGLKPSLLELELTESVVMGNVNESRRQLERLRRLGVGISIDDFGTGYSSLSYLGSLPIDTLKIDQSFLERVDSEAKKRQLVKAIVELAHGLKLKVVAEGVETEAQLEALRQVGCDRVQGFLTGEPISPEKVAELLGQPKRHALLAKNLIEEAGRRLRSKLMP